MIHCPNCNSTEFEARGSRRVYAKLDANLEIDGWQEADPDWIEWDELGDPQEGTMTLAVYCLNCDWELRKDDLLGDVATPGVTDPPGIAKG
jgi:hypothetical protein